MTATVYKLNYNETISDDIIEACYEAIMNKAIILYPSDTCYMFTGLAFDPIPVSKIYETKNRNLNKPMSILFKDIDMLSKYVCVNDVLTNEIKKYLPGPYTLLLPTKKCVNYYAIGNSNKVGVRMIDFEPVNKLINKVNAPIITTSANVSGFPSPYSMKEIDMQYNNVIFDKVKIILDYGELPNNPLSAIINI